MPLNGAGIFSRIYSWVADRDAGSPSHFISATKMDAEFDGIVTALSAALYKDGQQTSTANQPMAGFRHTNVGEPTATNQYATVLGLQKNNYTWVDSGGTANAITATYSPAVAALVDGLLLFFRATAANTTTTPTFAPNGLVAKTIVKQNGAALVTSDIPGDNYECIVRYNSGLDQWVLLNPNDPRRGGTTIKEVASDGTVFNLEVAVTRNAQTGTSYTYLTSDRGKHVTHLNAAAIAGTLPQAGSTGFASDWYSFVENVGAGRLTITPTTSTINGAPTLKLDQNQFAFITSDGTNYRALVGGAPGRQTIPLNASAFDSRTTGGAASGLAESSVNKIMERTFDFDKDTRENIQIRIPMPISWNEGTLSYQVGWRSSGSGDVIFGMEGVAISDDDTYDAAFGTAQTVTDTLTNTGDLMWSPESSAITIAGTPAAGDLVVLQLYRDAAAGGDTLNADARVVAVRLFVTFDAYHDIA